MEEGIFFSAVSFFNEMQLDLKLTLRLRVRMRWRGRLSNFSAGYLRRGGDTGVLIRHTSSSLDPRACFPNEGRTRAVDGLCE